MEKLFTRAQGSKINFYPFLAQYLAIWLGKTRAYYISIENAGSIVIMIYLGRNRIRILSGLKLYIEFISRQLWMDRYIRNV